MKYVGKNSMAVETMRVLGADVSCTFACVLSGVYRESRSQWFLVSIQYGRLWVVFCGSVRNVRHQLLHLETVSELIEYKG